VDDRSTLAIDLHKSTALIVAIDLRREAEAKDRSWPNAEEPGRSEHHWPSPDAEHPYPASSPRSLCPSERTSLVKRYVTPTNKIKKNGKGISRGFQPAPFETDIAKKKPTTAPIER